MFVSEFPKGITTSEFPEGIIASEIPDFIARRVFPDVTMTGGFSTPRFSRIYLFSCEGLMWGDMYKVAWRLLDCCVVGLGLSVSFK